MKMMLGKVEFRTHPILNKDTLILMDTKAFPLAEQNRWIAFVDSEETFIKHMVNPESFLKKFQEIIQTDPTNGK